MLANDGWLILREVVSGAGNPKDAKVTFDSFDSLNQTLRTYLDI